MALMGGAGIASYNDHYNIPIQLLPRGLSNSREADHATGEI